MNLSTTRILLLTLLSAAVYANNCAHNCQKCYDPGFLKSDRCGVCYRSVLYNNYCKAGGPLNCDISISDTFCYRCSERFLLDITTGLCTQARGTISSCASGYIDAEGNAFCDACIGFAPSADSKLCNAPQKYQNCIWETSNSCERCNDGFSWDTK